MFRTWNRTIRTFLRAAPIGAVLLLVVAPASPAAAQTHCANWVDTLLTYENLPQIVQCVSDPAYDRASDVETFRWNGHDYMIFNRGNELSIFNIDDPKNPTHTTSSNFEFGTRGDSDYDLIDFDVCNDCRYGVLAHKLKRTVVFDLGAGATPAFVKNAYASYGGLDLNIGGYVFSKGGQEYLISGTGPGVCDGSTLYTLDGVSALNPIGCLAVGGAAILVKGLHDYDTGAAMYLFAGAGGRVGTTHVFRADGAGSKLSLTYITSPVGMQGQRYELSIDGNNGLLASGNLSASEIQIWDIVDPEVPKRLWTVPGAAGNVSLRSPSAGSVPTLMTNVSGWPDSTRTFTVGSTGPEEFEADYWTDESLVHNDLPICAFPAGGALSPDGSVLFLSRYAIHQVFDLSGCLQPTPAVADLTISPSTPFPGDTVTIRDTTTGRVDRWAVWVTEEPSGIVVAGTQTPSALNPHQIEYAIPQNIAWGTSYKAHVLVDSADLSPDYSSCEANPNCNGEIVINREPQASIMAEPLTVVVGESVTLTATEEGTPSNNPYLWTIFPPSKPTIYDTGKSITVPLDQSGLWNIDLAVTYDHLLADGSPYRATAKIENFSVTSVAADFTISPTNPLNTQDITLYGSISKPVGGNLAYEWTVESLYHTYAGCPATADCTIPGGSLSPGTPYSVTLKVTNNDDGVTDSETKMLTVTDGSVVPTISFSPSSPEIGTNVVVTIGGVLGEVDKTTWTMGGPGCDGASSTQTCTPSPPWVDCKALAFEYASGGTKPVHLEVQIGGNVFTADTSITVASTGSCIDGGGGGGGGGVCAYTLSRQEAIVGAAGGESTFRVVVDAACPWTAHTTFPWITVLSPTGGDSGIGTVRFRVDENTGPERVGTIIAAGQVFIVRQNAPYVPANFSMSNTKPEIGETVTFAVDPILDVASWNFGEPDCRGNSPIINCFHLPSGTCNTMQWSYSSDGYKTITMTLTDGRIKVKKPIVRPKGICCLADGRPDASFTMTHAIPDVSGEAVIIPVVDEIYAGEEVFFTDTSSKSFSKNSKALGINSTPPSPEIGQDVTFTLSGLIGTITKATWDFGDVGCDGPSTDVCVPDGQWVDCKAISFKYASGGPKSVSVEIELEGGATNTAGPVTITVANTGTCGGGEGGCSYTLSSTSNAFPPEGGHGSFDVRATDGCEWTATPSHSWFTIGTASGVGSGTVDYTVDVNPQMSTRSGTIRVEGRTHRVIQAGDPGDTAPTEWWWTITRVEDEDGEPVNEDVFASTDQNTRFLFETPGRYRVSLLTANCFGVDSSLDYITVTETPVEDFVVGAALSMDGANETHWESDLRFYNPCAEELDVRIEYRPENTNNVGANLFFREFALAADETRIFADITEAMPGLEGEETTGSVRIESTSASGCKVLSVSRTYNETAEGSLGLFVPALPVKKLRQPFLDVTGLIQNASYRTNLRLVNYGEADVWVPLRAFQRNGDQVGQERSVLVRGLSTKQINEVSKWLGIEEDLAPFTVRADVDGLELHVLGTVVDNVTGDSVLYLPSVYDADRIWLVGVANLEGVNESQWRTDVWLYNPTDNWLAGELEFVVGDSPSDVFGFSWPVLNNLRIKQYLDIVGEELGLTETRGYIELRGDERAPQVAARTYNIDQTGGTYGLNLQPFASDDLLMPGEVGYIAGVSNSEDQSVGFRTNMGFLNTDRNGWTGLRITMYKLDGSLAAEPYEFDIAPGKLLQFDIFKKFGLRKVTMTGSVKIEVLNGGGVAAYATEIDNRTQDSIFIPALQKFQGEVPK